MFSEWLLPQMQQDSENKQMELRLTGTMGFDITWIKIYDGGLVEKQMRKWH